MDIKEFRDYFNELLNFNNIVINDEKINLFYKYMNNLIEWNNKINLTAIKNENEIILKHFIDSIAIKEYIEEDRMLDIGSGAGLPGIPLKIVNDNLKVTLIDAVNKKVNFMNDTISKLNLKNIESLHFRAEDLAFDKNYRECFNTVVSRAVSNMTTLVEYMLPFTKIGGVCLCMKGPKIEDELNSSKYAIKLLGGEIEKVINYKIDNENERNIIIIRKKIGTEQTYPRKNARPVREPLIEK